MIKTLTCDKNFDYYIENSVVEGYLSLCTIPGVPHFFLLIEDYSREEGRKVRSKAVKPTHTAAFSYVPPSLFNHVADKMDYVGYSLDSLSDYIPNISNFINPNEYLTNDIAHLINTSAITKNYICLHKKLIRGWKLNDKPNIFYSILFPIPLINIFSKSKNFLSNSIGYSMYMLSKTEKDSITKGGRAKKIEKKILSM
jgi:hypothetical protein